MDTIFINGLVIETTIGVHAWEKQLKQKITLDLELHHDFNQAAKSDSINDTLDYSAIAKRVTAFAAEQKCHLLETLGNKIAQLLKKEFNAPHFRLKITKPGALRGAKEVGIIIER